MSALSFCSLAGGCGPDEESTAAAASAPAALSSDAHGVDPEALAPAEAGAASLRLLDVVEMRHLKRTPPPLSAEDSRWDALSASTIDDFAWRLDDFAMGTPLDGAQPAVAQLIHDDFRHAAPAFEISASTPRNANLRFDPLPARAATAYTFLGHLKAENVEQTGAGFAATFLIEERTAQGSSTFHAGKSKTGTSADWELVTLQFTTQTTTVELVVHACLGAAGVASGRVVFDDMVLFEHRAPPPPASALEGLANEIVRTPWRFESVEDSIPDRGRDQGWGPPEAVRLKAKLALAGDVRSALLAPVPSRFEIPIEAGTEGRLRIAFGVHLRAARPETDAVRFKVEWLDADGAALTLIDESLVEMDPAREGRWMERVLEVPRAESGATLVLESSAPPELQRSIAAFGDLLLERPTRDTHTPRHVILFSLDTLRADHLGTYGFPLDTSPFLDELAQTGVVFERALAPAPFTLPSHMSMLTGLSPSRHGVFVENRQRLGSSIETLAESFQSRGFRTAGVHSGGLIDSSYGFSEGFDLYDYRNSLEKTFGRARDILRTHANQDLFLFVHTYHVHSPYKEQPEHLAAFANSYETLKADFEGEVSAATLGSNSFLQDWNQRTEEHPESWLRGVQMLYAGEIRELDTTLRGFFDGLDEFESAERVVAISSDHGDGFLEHGKLLHGNSLYNELLHVPLILIGLPGARAGRRVTDTVGLIDLAPTLLEAIGLDVDTAFDGHSLLPLARGEQPPLDRALEANLLTPGETLFAVMRDDHKYLVDAATGAEELYDLDADAGETTNLASTQTQKRAELRADLMTVLARLPGLHIVWHGEGRAVEWTLGGVVNDAQLRRFFLPEGARLTGPMNTEPVRLNAPGSFTDRPWLNIEPAASGDSLRLRVRIDGGPPRPELIHFPAGEALRPDDDGVFEIPLERLLVDEDWRAPGPDAPAGLYVWLNQTSGPSAAQLNAEQRDHLRALGYLK